MKISVVIPLYNKKDTVLRALQSVFAQTIQPLEIIVVNDGSIDGSEKVVEALNHPLVRLVHQPNAGVSAARNKGIELAEGDWIAFLDADDEWLPKFLETVEFLHKHFPQAGVLATAYYLQDHQGEKISNILNQIPFNGEYGIISNYFEVASNSHPPLWSSAVCVKKTALNQIVGFPKGIKSGEDLLTWARLAVINDIAYHTSPLSVFIQDAAHTYQDKPNRIPQPKDMVGEQLKELWRQNKSIMGLRKYIAHWHKMRSSVFLRLGYRKNAIREAVKSLYYDWTNHKVYMYVLLCSLPTSCLHGIFRKFGSK